MRPPSPYMPYGPQMPYGRPLTSQFGRAISTFYYVNACFQVMRLTFMQGQVQVYQALAVCSDLTGPTAQSTITLAALIAVCLLGPGYNRKPCYSLKHI